ncbi:hypothetical protein M7794_05025 [Enterobacter chuandaensis]|uniref:hypothetical protein n=1 Tax=Enterobacter chuandaensis TaxID=2497875 RepID=UPI00223726E7|nr:hypothetical protein [Enterobacter chuandaensis]MCW4781407.1 hypothetical protein [Enterobacter chuandaensis]
MAFNMLKIKFLNKNYNKLYKFADQLSFSLLNIGVVLFASVFLEPAQASKYIIMNVYSSYSLVLIMAFVITPFWVFCSDKNKKKQYNKFSLRLALVVSAIVGSIVFFIVLIEEGSMTYAFTVFYLTISYSIYDFLRRSFFIINKDSIAAFLSTMLIVATIVSYAIMLLLNITDATTYLFTQALILTTITMAGYILNRKEYGEPNNNIDYWCLCKQYLSIGKWSAASMTCFWLATQGVFIIYENNVEPQFLALTRLALSVSGVIAIYFSSIENKIMPELSNQISLEKYSEVNKIAERYLKNSLYASIVLTILLILASSLIIGANNKYLFLILVMCIFQCISGVLKIFPFILKAKKRHKDIFLSNLLSILIIFPSTTYLYNFNINFIKENILTIIIFFNGIFSSLLYIYFTLFERGK